MKEKLENIRHSLAHLLAAAVLELWPDAKRAIGPVIEDGFYYDFEFPKQDISEENLHEIEDRMKEILNTWRTFERKEISAKEARELFADNPYKLELIDEYGDGGLTLYKSGEYIDLCEGGHVDDAKNINPEAFKLTHLAGAYWRGNEKNKMLTRIYGVAFETKKELDEYLLMIEEAKKRDHRKLGQELDLFTFSPLVGNGLPLFLPKGATVKNVLEEFIKEEKEKLGYSFVSIPHIAKVDLYKKSGHLGKYDAMMPIMTAKDGSQFVMKAMNCPHHFEIYNSRSHSYRDLPLRYAENTAVYRNEKSGELSGLLRVMSITQDDTHHFVRHDQIQSEIGMIIGLMEKIFSTFGFSDYKVEISVRDLKNKEKYFGDDKLWDEAEKNLIEAVKNWGASYTIEEGEAAFYGPKIDIKVRDAIGRSWQLTTMQLDFVQPENFKMRYIGEDGKEHTPAVIHVAIFGSLERIMAVLIEHYAGVFPMWLSPIQVVVAPISEKQNEYAVKVAEQLKENGIRIEIYDQNETIGKKIRLAETQKVPYILIVGAKEAEAGSVAVRKRGEGDKGQVQIEEFIGQLKEEIAEKK